MSEIYALLIAAERERNDEPKTVFGEFESVFIPIQMFTFTVCVFLAILTFVLRYTTYNDGLVAAVKPSKSDKKDAKPTEKSASKAAPAAEESK